MTAEQPLSVRVSGDVPERFMRRLRTIATQDGVTVELPPREGDIPDLETQKKITKIIGLIVRADDPSYNWDKVFNRISQGIPRDFRGFRGIGGGSKRWINDFQRKVTSHRIDPLILSHENSHRVQPIKRVSGHQALLVDGLYIPLLAPSGIPGAVLNFLSSKSIDLSFLDEWYKERIQRALKDNLTFLDNHFALGLRLGPLISNKIYLELPGNVNILEPQTLVMRKPPEFRVQ